MQTLEVWRLEAVYEDRNRLIARFSSEAEAEKAKPFAGGYGGKVAPETIKIFDTASEWSPGLDEEARRSGLEKLTERERQALGLSGG